MIDQSSAGVSSLRTEEAELVLSGLRACFEGRGESPFLGCGRSLTSSFLWDPASRGPWPGRGDSIAGKKGAVGPGLYYCFVPSRQDSSSLANLSAGDFGLFQPRAMTPGPCRNCLSACRVPYLSCQVSHLRKCLARILVCSGARVVLSSAWRALPGGAAKSFVIVAPYLKFRFWQMSRHLM